MAAKTRSDSGFAAMGGTAVGGLDPSEHQGVVPPDLPGAELTPSELEIPPRGSGFTGENVGATSPGSGTSISGAGGRPGPGGTMTEGIWSRSRPILKTTEPPGETSTGR